MLQVDQLQGVCDQRSVCLLQLQRGQQCLLSRLEDRRRSREEAWSRQHAHTVAQLQVAHTHTHVRSHVRC